MKIFSKHNLQEYLADSRKTAPPHSQTAVILCASADHNCTFNIQTYNFSKVIREFVSKNYKVFFHEMKNADIDGALDSLSLPDRSVDVLYIAAHGHLTYTHFGSGPTGNLYVEAIPHLRLQPLASKVSICFFSCFAGVSIAPEFQKLLPEATIWAAKVVVYNCVYLQTSKPVFVFDDGSPNLVSNERVNSLVPERQLKEANWILKRTSATLFKSRNYEKWAKAGDVKSQSLIGLSSPVGSAKRLFWLKKSYEGENRLTLPHLLSELICQKLYNEFKEVCLSAFEKDHVKYPAELDSLAKTFSFSMANSPSYDFSFIQHMITKIGIYINPYLRILSNCSPFSEACRATLFLSLPYNSSEAITLFHQSSVLKDQWPYYIGAKIALDSGFIDAAIYNLKFSIIPESYQLLKRIAETTHHPEAFFDLYLRNRHDLASLYTAAYYGHPHACFIFTTQALPPTGDGPLLLGSAGSH